jgi:AcrR family transcriptional regulator
MKAVAKKKGAVRRRPLQQRAQVTVVAMLDAAIKLLKRGDASSITTNAIAEAAGVSIGSVYQYFPNKRAIFIALHERHIEQVDRILERRLIESADATLEGLVASLIDGMIEAHATDPELSELLHSEVPHRANGARDFSARLHDVFRRALAPHSRDFGRRVDLDTRTFVVINMIEALGHAITLRRPRGSSFSQAKAESLQAIMAYLQH